MTDSGVIRLLMELRGQGVTDMRLQKVFESTPRNLFVPDDLVDQAWENVALPIGCGQTISQPIVVALMTQKLALSERMRVLEVGTGLRLPGRDPVASGAAGVLDRTTC